MQDLDPTLYAFRPMATQKGDVMILDPDGGKTFADKSLTDPWLHAIADHLRRQFAAKKLHF